MLRSVSSVIIGYLVMALLVMITFSATLPILGANREPGPWPSSGLWITISMVLGLIAAFCGGWVCALIAQRRLEPQVLSAIVFVLGLVMAVLAMSSEVKADGAPPRHEQVAAKDGVRDSGPPIWVEFANPIIGVAGLIVGAEWRLRNPDQMPAA